MARREAPLDLLRVLAALCVILLHCAGPVLGTAALYGTRSWWLCGALNAAGRMGVPLFFMLSGCLHLGAARTRDALAFWRGRLPRILLPFLVWDGVYYLLNARLAGTAPSAGEFFRQLLVQGSSYHLWFVYSLVGLYLLAPFLAKLTAVCTRGELWLLLAVILLPTTLLRTANLLTGVYLYLFAPLVEGYAGFFLLGYLLSTAEPSPRRLRLALAALAAGLLVNVFGNAWFSSAAGIVLPFNEGYALNHYLAAGGLFVLVRALRVPERAGRALAALSGATYGIYLSHVLFLQLFQRLLRDALPPAALAVCLFALASLCASALALLLRRIPVLGRLLT